MWRLWGCSKTYKTQRVRRLPHMASKEHDGIMILREISLGTHPSQYSNAGLCIHWHIAACADRYDISILLIFIKEAAH